uniref:Uncharacterized protein n=1 Tax=Rhizophagus irregularis (strain DAOM 181602 / DAOM 197198 / MUCL 43194) TaxID=747089 RepID=U9TKP3_RHIID
MTEFCPSIVKMWILLEGLPSPLKLGADLKKQLMKIARCSLPDLSYKHKYLFKVTSIYGQKYGKREIPYTSGSFDQLEALAREFFGDLEEGTFILCGKTVEWDYGSHGYGPIDYWQSRKIWTKVLLRLSVQMWSAIERHEQDHVIYGIAWFIRKSESSYFSRIHLQFRG